MNWLRKKQTSDITYRIYDYNRINKVGTALGNSPVQIEIQISLLLIAQTIASEILLTSSFLNNFLL